LVIVCMLKNQRLAFFAPIAIGAMLFGEARLFYCF
jgi:hypothetical protein